MADIFGESDREIEAIMGMSLEQARDVTSLTYINIVFRIAARELGVPMPTHEAVVEGVGDLTVALNCGANVAFCVFVEDKKLAQKMVHQLQAIVDDIPEKT